MKLHTLQKKILTGVLISTQLCFLGAPLQTQAASSFLSSLSGSGIFGTLLGCTGAANAIQGGIGKLFGQLSKGSEGGDSVDQKVPTSDSVVQTSTGNVEKKESCSDAIAYSLSRVALHKLTESTLNWINSGFQGEPTYVKNAGGFFKSIADEQLGIFTSGIAFNPNAPFGRDIAQKIVNTVSGQLDLYAQQSRNDLLNDSPLWNNSTYEAKFQAIQDDLTIIGGWDNYIQVNTLGWANPADAEIRAINIAGSTQNAANAYKDPIKQTEEELRQSGGFLGLKKCNTPSDYEAPETDTSFTLAQAQAQNDPNDSDTRAAQQWLKKHTCTWWATQTPGQAISQQLNINLGSSVRQLELANEMNESLSAVFDALMKQLFNKGIASLSGESSSSGGSSVQQFGGYGSNTGAPTFAVGSGNISADQWYNQNQNFDLITALAPNGRLDPDPSCEATLQPGDAPSVHAGDPSCVQGGFVSQGILITLKEYIALLHEQNQYLQEAVRWIHEFDYCVPGPRPDWYSTALDLTQESIARVEDKNNLISTSETNAAIQHVLDPGGIFDLLGTDTTIKKRRNINIDEFRYFVGFEPEYDIDKDHAEVDFQFSQNFRNAIMQTLKAITPGTVSYKEQIDALYTNTTDANLANLNILNQQEYRKAKTFESTLSDNVTEINLLNTYIPRMESIYNNLIVAQATYNINSANPDLAGYRRYYDNQLRIFASMAGGIKTDDSIDAALSDTETTLHETAYASDKTSGLVKTCVDMLPVLSTNLVRRPYGATHATTNDYLSKGWTTAPSLPTNQTFLKSAFITANEAAFLADIPHAIYLAAYSQQCPGSPPTHLNQAMPIDLNMCLGGAPLSSPGDRYENHIQSY